jgi:hypothetical protein
MRFGIVVYDDVEPIDIGATFGVLSMARRIEPAIAMFLVAARAGSVRLAGGLQIVEIGFFLSRVRFDARHEIGRDRSAGQVERDVRVKAAHGHTVNLSSSASVPAWCRAKRNVREPTFAEPFIQCWIDRDDRSGPGRLCRNCRLARHRFAAPRGASKRTPLACGFLAAMRRNTLCSRPDAHLAWHLATMVPT